MNVQFDWWLLIVGFVIGAGLTGLVLAELRRREDDLTAREREAEAALIAADMTAHGIPADAEAVGEVLRLHRLYLAGLPADDPDLDAVDADRVELIPQRFPSTLHDRPATEPARPDSTGGSPPDTREDARSVG